MAGLLEDALILKIMTDAADIPSKSFDSIAQAAAAWVYPLLITLMSLYVLIWGWAMMRGMVQEPVMDAVMRFAKMALVFYIATQWAFYVPTIRQVVWEAPEDISSAIIKKDTQSTILTAEVFGAALKIGSAYVTDADELSGSSGVPDLSLLAIGIGVWGGGAALTGIIVGTLIIAKIILAVLLAVGPIFIVMILFESTKKLFDSWLGQVVSYMIVIVTTIITATLVMEIMTNALEHYVGLELLNTILEGDFTAEGLSSPSPGTGIGLIVIYGICGVAIQKIVMAADAIGRSVSLTSYVGYK